MRRRALGLLTILSVAACGTTTTSPSPIPTATATAGPLEIRGGDLPAGTYTHSGFEPMITFDLGEGWQGVQNANGFFDVQQDPATPDVVAVQFGNVDTVYGKDGSEILIGGAADAVPAIVENPGLRVLGQSSSLMSGLEGFTVEVENAAPLIVTCVN